MALDILNRRKEDFLFGFLALTQIQTPVLNTCLNLTESKKSPEINLDLSYSFYGDAYFSSQAELLMIF